LGFPNILRRYSLYIQNGQINAMFGPRKRPQITVMTIPALTINPKRPTRPSL
jgi:hypothetical protein